MNMLGSDKFHIHHWEFYLDGDDIMVYEERGGDVIGHLNYDGTIDDLKEELDGENEEFVNSFIEDTIEWY